MDVREHRGAVLEVADRLILDFTGQLAPGTVVRCVLRCRDELILRGAGDEWRTSIEAMARARLAQRRSHALR